VSVPDLADAGERWPVFVAAVAKRGAYRSVHALPLRLRGEAIGTLNLFHSQPGALPEADLALGQALADVATIGILSERAIRHSEVVTEQLQTALNHRVIIEQAKGVLAHRGNLTMAAAFDRLRRYARNHNARLSEVACKVVETDLAADVLDAPAVRSQAADQR
jgi:GAF domain-containing protein